MKRVLKPPVDIDKALMDVRILSLPSITPHNMFSSQTVPSLREDVDYVGNSKNWAPRTPGRTLKGRAGLQENMLHNGAMTAHPKEKKVTLKTPFNQGTKRE